mmetsp:Transcript_26143/g.49722  ORF Transcript_26143/g.49722 Transcript_26143/m.49722 type:complete len:229 (+) Transcript_26143:1835-2521(+)
MQNDMRLGVVITQYPLPVPSLEQIYQQTWILEVVFLVTDPNQIPRAPVERRRNPRVLLERRLDILVVDGRPGDGALDCTGSRKRDAPRRLLGGGLVDAVGHCGGVGLVRDGGTTSHRMVCAGVVFLRGGDDVGPRCCGSRRLFLPHRVCEQFIPRIFPQCRDRPQQRGHDEGIEITIPHGWYRCQQGDGIILHESSDQIPRCVGTTSGGIVVPPTERGDEPLSIAPRR